MKKLIPLLGLLIVTLVVSCEAEQLKETENAVNLETTQKATATNLGGDEGDSEAVLFERRMAWFSFLTVKVVDEIPSQRAYLNGLLSANNTIQTSQLFGSEPYSTFETKFRSLLYDQLEGDFPDPDPDRDKPGEPIVPIPDPLTEDPIDLAVQDYIDYIVSENCVELFLPNGSLVTSSGGIDSSYTYWTSLAHPLNTNSWNEGIERLERFAPYPLNGYTTDVSVDNIYVAQNDNIVVARPKTTFDCPYTEYGTLDFTVFLD